MASEVEALRLAIIDLTVTLKTGGGKNPGKPGDAKPGDDGKKKATSGFAGLASQMGKFAATLVGVGTVLKGLSGTREGYHLDYAMNHIFYEIADMLRGPIRFITNELEGLANVIHRINHSTGGVEGMVTHLTNPIATQNEADREAFKDTARLSESARRRHPEIAALSDAETERRLHPEMAQVPKAVLERQAKEGKLKGYDRKAPELPGGGRGNDHLQPMLTTSFSDVAGLQAKMQALSTENPAQERELSIMENIYNMLVKIYNAIPGFGDKAQEIPNPAIKKD